MNSSTQSIPDDFKDETSDEDREEYENNLSDLEDRYLNTWGNQ